MGLFDPVFGSPDKNAQDYLSQALQAYQNVQVPTIASETIGQLPMESVQGTVTPGAIPVTQQAPSAYGAISLDPSTRAAQMLALSQYTDIANAQGLDPAAKLRLQQVLDAATAQARGEQGAIMNAAQAEGQGGGDFALTQRALAAQGASDTAATQGMEAAAEAEANRQNALNQMANIGGQVNASDYAQAQAKAAAQNEINARNMAATNQAALQNIQNQIQSGEFNVNTAQGVNAANTAAGQNRAYYNASLPQRQFENELAKAGGVAGVNQTRASTAMTGTGQQLQFLGTALGAAGQIGAKAAGAPAAPATPAARGGVIGYNKGGTCYAAGGVSHDHRICEKLGTVDLRGGGQVIARSPDEKAEVPGDSESNDKIPAELSEGELVIPRSVPKTGPEMEKFARNAPVPGTDRKVDLTSFTSGYRRPR